jgi:hypothetical protein
VGTVLGTTTVALLVAAGSFAGLRSVLRDPNAFQTGEYEVFERTATVEAFTVTSPSDWFLVNEWPLSMQIAVENSGGASTPCVAAPGNTTEECDETPGEVTSSPVPVPHGLPMLQLSNVDMGLGSIACRDGLPEGAAVLYVALDHERTITGIADPSIPPFPPDPGLPAEGDGPCGPGRYAHFTVNGEPFFSWIGLGSGVSDEDRATVQTAYEMMSAIDDWTPEPPARDTPGFVVAGGRSAAGNEWRIEARPGTEVELSLFAPAPSGAPQISLGDAPLYWCCSSMTTPGEAGDPIFGAVQPEAAVVEFRPSDGRDPIRGTILPSPPSLGSDFDLFFIEGTGGLEGDVVALRLEDRASEPPAVTEPREERVELSGTFLDQTWDVRFTGAFADRSACIRVTIEEAYEPLCPRQLDTSLAGAQPSMHGWVTTRLHLLAGSVPPDVVEIRFTSDGGATPPTRFPCRTGPLGWTNPDRKVCVLALPPEGSGIFRYLDANGRVLFEEGMGWGSAAAALHEYPWTNVGGTITAQGVFQGADWTIEVLYYQDGYRLSIDGREVFEGILREGDPAVFPLFEGERGRSDALLLLVDGERFAQDVAVASDRTWEGRWLPGSTANGGKARLWVVELPGAGTGSLVLDGVDRGPVTWP